ncbi:hypothetical protein OPQ81_011758 [Rhizoctonia solani]|nr:hypothetical protein OPQ81_011758 [Rhizoctonia solani]
MVLTALLPCDLKLVRVSHVYCEGCGIAKCCRDLAAVKTSNLTRDDPASSTNQFGPATLVATHLHSFLRDITVHPHMNTTQDKIVWLFLPMYQPTAAVC